MKEFTNLLDNIKIASPCSANWNEMFGDERQRYCSECKLNVYNLSDMTRTEAENFLINSEGRVCVKFYRRNDGTVLTQDCPVGWAKIKRKVSRTAKAFFSICAGMFGGIFAFNYFQPNYEIQSNDKNLMNAVEIDSNAPINKISDFEKKHIPEKPVFDEQSQPELGGLVGSILVEKDNKKSNKRKINSKIIRKR